jgi:hypothetical protein
LAVGALVLAGCSTPTHVDHGTIHASTFSFVNTRVRAVPSYAEQRERVHLAIQDAITRTLAARGLTRAATGGDVTVGYLVILGNNVTTELVSDYFGFGDDAAALQDKAHGIYTGSKNPNYFESGTLLIDIADSKSFKLLKRGYATRPTLRNLPEQDKAARIQDAVDEILADVRVSR